MSTSRASRLRWSAAMGLLGVFVVCGCNEGRSSLRRGGAAAEVDLAADAVVVATVDGAPITAGRVRKLAEVTGRTPREVVDRLVEFELLAAEAGRRGLHRHHDVRAVARQAAAQRYLEQDFKGQRQPEDIPEDVLRAAYKLNISHFVRPRLYKVAHILVKNPPQEESAPERAKVTALARQIALEARDVEGLEGFLAVGQRFDGRHGLEVLSEVLKVPVHEKARLQQPFIDASLALDAPGEIGGPVETSFGSHVIYLIKVREPSKRSFEEAREEVREKQYPYWLKEEFRELTRELRHSTYVEGFKGELRRDKAL